MDVRSLFKLAFMITLEFSGRASEDKRLHAGYEAEKKMAFYLDRAFREEAWIRVFHGLRIERQGEIAQIDHLVLHRFGFVLVESKSIMETISIDEHGYFSRSYRGQLSGMQSPIAQARLQAELLAKLLNDHKTKLRRIVGLGPLKSQGEFGDERFMVMAAISDRGRIECKGQLPAEVKKAEAVVEAIKEKIAYQQSIAGLGGFMGAVYAEFTNKQKAREIEKNLVHPFTDDEIEAITKFLIAEHKPGKQSTNGPTSTSEVKRESSPRSTPKTITSTSISRKHASSVPTSATASTAKPESRNMKRWTNEEKMRLRKAVETGQRPEDISSEFGRTANALRMYAQKMGLIEDITKW